MDGVLIEGLRIKLCEMSESMTEKLTKGRYAAWNFCGEFDPGSERTLAAWIRHASRTVKSSLLDGSVAKG